MTESPTKAGQDPKPGATVFAVTSGKGGVGKTSLSVNLSCEFSRRGYRTIIVDTDLGLANAHILAGIKPSRTLSDYLEGRAQLADVIEEGPAKVKFISGGSGVKEMANLDDQGRNRIVGVIEDLKPHCDVLVLDTGAGISRGVTDFVAQADHTIVVTTSNFAAIADAYGIIKVLVQDGYKNPLHCVVNRVRSPEEAEQVYMKLRGCTERFLGFDLNWLGLLPEDNSVEGAVLKRAPFSEAFPGSVASRYLAKLVTTLARYVSTVPKSAQAQVAAR
jgi:flagellar biosynthesis protein FlhG